MSNEGKSRHCMTYRLSPQASARPESVQLGRLAGATRGITSVELCYLLLQSAWRQRFSSTANRGAPL